MTHLYNCKHDGDQYRITKFDDFMNVESSYLCTADECECPAGVRPRCRHREMLPHFINRNAVGTGECFDYDRGGWVRMFEDEDQHAFVEQHAPLIHNSTEVSVPSVEATGCEEPSPPPVAPKRAGWRRF